MPRVNSEAVPPSFGFHALLRTRVRKLGGLGFLVCSKTQGVLRTWLAGDLPAPKLSKASSTFLDLFDVFCTSCLRGFARQEAFKAGHREAPFPKHAPRVLEVLEAWFLKPKHRPKGPRRISSFRPLSRVPLSASPSLEPEGCLDLDFQGSTRGGGSEYLAANLAILFA